MKTGSVPERDHGSIIETQSAFGSYAGRGRRLEQNDGDASTLASGFQF